jgi:phosphate transport system substrate-binding protein
MTMTTLLKRATAAVLSLGFTAAASGAVKLQGAGATFPNPIYQRWVTEYQKRHPGVAIDYQSIGSGGGIKQIIAKTVDFGASDAPMSKKEMDAAGAPLIHIPTVAGAVVPAYNLPGFSGELKLTGEILADIYIGKIQNWNDRKIAELNQGARLPNLPITPAWRTDGSGTTFVFTSYLATQSEEYKGSIGAGKQVDWPTGQGGKGNEGVTAIVQQTPGGIGYIEVNYATANKIPYALVRNAAGRFIKATPDSIAAAGAGAVDKMGASLAVDIWNQPAEDAYPISAFTYVLVYKDLSYLGNKAKAQALVDYLKWATGEGQSIATQMDYAPLAPAVQKKVAAAINSLTFSGTPVAAAR